MAIADDKLMSWHGGCALTRGFTTLRLRTNRIQGQVEELQWHSGIRTTEPVQLLCRMLRMAPACYRRFELTARRPDAPLQIQTSVLVTSEDWSRERVFRPKTASFDSVAELAAALQSCAQAEGLTVRVAPDEQCVILSRVGATQPADAGGPAV